VLRYSIIKLPVGKMKWVRVQGVGRIKICKIVGYGYKIIVFQPGFEMRSLPYTST